MTISKKLKSLLLAGALCIGGSVCAMEKYMSFARGLISRNTQEETSLWRADDDVAVNNNVNTSDVLVVVGRIVRSAQEQAALNDKLIVAIGGGNSNEVRRLLAAGADANCMDLKGDTALIRAVRNGFKKVVALLLDAGADIDVEVAWGWTAWKWAEVVGDEEIVWMIRRKLAKAALLGIESAAQKTNPETGEREARDNEIGRLPIELRTRILWYATGVDPMRENIRYRKKQNKR